MPIVVATPASPAFSGPGVIEIGLLNNLGDAGMEGVEHEFVDLLRLGAGDAHIRLRMFSLPSIARGPRASARMETTYFGLDTMFDEGLDGLFVTGAEPRESDLRDEVFWPDLSAVIDWAKSSTLSTIWSCLAAHAAVLRLDGIKRRPLSEKCTGVFEVRAYGDHPLLSGVGRSLQVCHSRSNGLDENELTSAGYDVLTSGAIGVDTFVRYLESHFVFLQGHPEYDEGALGREAKRDLDRWRANPSRVPALPTGYWSPEDEIALRAHVASGYNDPPPPTGAPMPWHRDVSRALFRNWLTLLRALKSENCSENRDHPFARAREDLKLVSAAVG